MTTAAQDKTRFSRAELALKRAQRAGCRALAYAPNGQLVGLYKARDAGVDADDPYVTVCEEHGQMVGQPSCRSGRLSMPNPAEWCSECRGED